MSSSVSIDFQSISTFTIKDMLVNYLKIAYRHLFKHKAYSLLNMLGLSIGMAACLIILQYVSFELSYDRGASQAENIYRIKTRYLRNGVEVYNSAKTFAGVGNSLQNDFPEVKQYFRLYPAGAWSNCVLTYTPHTGEPQQFIESNLFYADPTFFNMMGIPLLLGDEASALTQPNSIVMTKATAQKYVGTADPIGKAITIKDGHGNESRCVITGIISEAPTNCHILFDVLVSYSTMHSWRRGAEYYKANWNQNYFYTYIELQAGTDPKTIEEKLPSLVDKYKPRYTETDEKGVRIRVNELKLQPLVDLHLYSKLSDEIAPNGQARAVYFLLIIALFILVIAWVNYINLATARSVERAREVGMRKVIGASRWQLIRQFLSESMLLNILAAGLAITFVQFSLPYISQWMGISLNIDFWNNFQNYLGLIVLFVIGSLIAGFYPAFILSGFQPNLVLKGAFRSSAKGLRIRRTLVILQFSICTFLLIGTIAVYKQLNFMRNTDLGFHAEQLLVIETPSLTNTNDSSRIAKYKLFQQMLQQHPGILSVGRSANIPGKNILRGLAISRKPTDNLDEIRSIKGVHVDYDFVSSMGMKLLAGRNFSKEHGLDTAAVILTTSATKFLWFDKPEDAVDELIYLATREPYRVVGVIDDYHHESLHKAQDPMFLVLNDHASHYFVAQMDGLQLTKGMEHISNSWEEVFPANPLKSYFLDEYFDQQYNNDRQFGKAFSFFALLAICVACLGLFGLSSYSTLQRAKEIGIRKVLGASVHQILYLLSQEIILLVGISMIITLPLAYWGIYLWLQNFAYSMELTIGLLLFPMIIVLGLALLTVGYQSWKVANKNPVETLRYE